MAAVRSRGRFGISLGLQRIEALLAELGNPQLQLHGALVAGTNGKGSVVALARSALREAGLRVGTMPKPHLVSYRERIAIDGELLPRERFAAAIGRVLPVADDVAASLGPPTEFEVLTAAAFAELAGEHLDLVGPTLALIGAEKAGIIKAGNLAVTGAAGRGVVPIRDRCAALEVPLRRAGPRQPYRAALLHSGWDGLVVDVVTPQGGLADLRIGLLGGHQAANAAVALALLDALREDAARRGVGWQVDEAAIRRGFAAARWPGRLELLQDQAQGRILLDGAHNPAGARALAKALLELGVRRFPLVFGAMRGKRVTAVMRALAPLEPRPVFTRVPDAGAIEPDSLLRTWHRIADGGVTSATPRDALAAAAAMRVLPDQPVVVAGSLYLVGAVRGILSGEEGE
ncbi:MAG: bifunctional folylpolyglutamate synthase/dihydrofolate synthase [Gemmatimonadetes bacterium]|nr:MAG: bifunctional folylpolyglutamate synthase/dihydrofolate synthase [Gemmatimonadota bacterium]